MKQKNKNILKNVCIWGAIGLLAAGVVALGVNAIQNEPTKTLNSTHYAVGTIDTTTGENADSNLSFRMKDMQTTDGLVIDIKENAKVTYDIYFYNADKEFVGVQEDLAIDIATQDISPEYEYFRIAITPNQVDGENVVCTLLNKITYTTNQISVTFDNK
ncbi:MAG: hypothetical protein ACLRFR_00675 [Clostridia bacterium]